MANFKKSSAAKPKQKATFADRPSPLPTYFFNRHFSISAIFFDAESASSMLACLSLRPVSAEREKARKTSLFTEPAPAISGADHTSLFPVIFR